MTVAVIGDKLLQAAVGFLLATLLWLPFYGAGLVGFWCWYVAGCLFATAFWALWEGSGLIFTGWIISPFLKSQKRAGAAVASATPRQ